MDPLDAIPLDEIERALRNVLARRDELLRELAKDDFVDIEAEIFEAALDDVEHY
jgi:hypothetical protein